MYEDKEQSKKAQVALQITVIPTLEWTHCPRFRMNRLGLMGVNIIVPGR